MATLAEQQRIKGCQQRHIAFPDVESFLDLFPTSQPYDSKAALPSLLTLPSWESGTWSDKARKTVFQVGGYCIARRNGNFGSFQVTSISELLKEYIRNNVLHCSNDRMHFEVVFWNNNRAAIYLQHGVIIGSHTLAVVDASTIPNYEEE